MWLNVDGIIICTRTYVKSDSDQIGHIYLGEEELKVRRIGHDAMMEQDAVHIGYGEMLLPTKLRPGLRRMHQEMNSEAASCLVPPPKRARVEEGVQTNETMQDFNGTIEELRRPEGSSVQKTMLSTEEDRDMWKRLFEDCNQKQGEEKERLRREYKQRSERLALMTAVEKMIPTKNVPRGQSPMKLLTPRELSQTTETRLSARTGRVTIPDPR